MPEINWRIKDRADHPVASVHVTKKQKQILGQRDQSLQSYSHGGNDLKVKILHINKLWIVYAGNMGKTGGEI